MIRRFLRMRFKNVTTAFDPVSRVADLEGHSYAELERISIQAMKSAVIDNRKEVRESDFRAAIADERRRRRGNARLTQSK